MSVLMDMRGNTAAVISDRHGGKRRHFSYALFYYFWTRAYQKVAELRDGGGVTVVAIVGRTGIEWLLVDLACLATGVVTLAIPEDIPKCRMGQIVEKWNPDLIVTIGNVSLDGKISGRSVSYEKLFGNLDDPCESDPGGGHVRFRETGANYYTVAFTSGTQKDERELFIPYPALQARKPLRYGKTMIWGSFTHYIQRFLALRAFALRYDLCFTSELSCIADLRNERPTEISAAPIIFSLLAEVARAKLRAASPLSRGALAIFNLTRANRLPPDSGVRKVFDYWLSIFTNIYGGRPEAFFSSGAAIATSTVKLLDRIGLQVLSSYGISEIGPISVQTRQTFRVGSVGRPSRDVKISDIGEILVKADGLVRDTSCLAINEDGYIQTGDAGFLKAGHLFVTGRLDDIIILSNGIKVRPQEIEIELSAISGISRAAVFSADNLRLSAVLVCGPPLGDLDAIRAVLNHVNSRVSADERIRRFCVVDDFSISDRTLTHSLKMRRRVIVEKYAGHLFHNV